MTRSHIIAMFILMLVPIVLIAQDRPSCSVRTIDSTIISGTVLDNFPPVYAVLLSTSSVEQMIDYGMLTEESATLLSKMTPTRYGANAMPQIDEVSSRESEHAAIERVYLRDGKILSGRVSYPRYKNHVILRWPSGEEWYCENTDIDSIVQVTLDRPVVFQEFRHYYTGIASILSIMVPATGHIYNGDYAMAGVHFAALATSIGLGLAVMNNSTGLGAPALAMLPVFGARLADVIDAGNTAANRERQRNEWQRSRCSRRTPVMQPAIGFGIAPIPDGAVAGIAVWF